MENEINEQDESNPSTAPRPRVVLTREQQLKLTLKMEKLDRDLEKLFANGADLSGRETP